MGCRVRRHVNRHVVSPWLPLCPSTPLGSQARYPSTHSKRLYASPAVSGGSSYKRSPGSWPCSDRSAPHIHCRCRGPRRCTRTRKGTHGKLPMQMISFGGLAHGVSKPLPYLCANKGGRVALATVGIAVSDAVVAVCCQSLRRRGAGLLGHGVRCHEGGEGEGDDLGELHLEGVGMDRDCLPGEFGLLDDDGDGMM